MLNDLADYSYDRVIDATFILKVLLISYIARGRKYVRIMRLYQKK